MKQLNVPEELKVPVDYEKSGLSEYAVKLQPLVFRDGSIYSCVFGPDLKKGIFGFGDSVYEACEDWERRLKQRLKHPRKNDEVIEYIKTTLNISGN